MSGAPPRVTIYTKDHCPYCVRLKRLLDRKGVAYVEVNAEHRPELREWLVGVTGMKTVPQLFVGDRPLGGCTDVEELERRGELDEVLGAG